MKGIINLEGTLIITPENETEAFALKKWNDAYISPERHGVQLAICYAEGITQESLGLNKLAEVANSLKTDLFAAYRWEGSLSLKQMDYLLQNGMTWKPEGCGFTITKSK